MKKPASAPSPAPPAELLEAQGRALDALALGESPQAAAAAAGVPLGELFTWLASDAAFIAAHNRRRRLAVQLHADRLRFLAARALDALAEGLDAEQPAVRVKAADVLLRLGVEAPPVNGAIAAHPETVEGVRDMWAEAAASVEQDRKLRDLLRGF